MIISNVRLRNISAKIATSDEDKILDFIHALYIAGAKIARIKIFRPRPNGLPREIYLAELITIMR
jgi:hypothetical protein